MARYIIDIEQEDSGFVKFIKALFWLAVIFGLALVSVK